jgi:hypothetical protein
MRRLRASQITWFGIVILCICLFVRGAFFAQDFAIFETPRGYFAGSSQFGSIAISVKGGRPQVHPIALHFQVSEPMVDWGELTCTSHLDLFLLPITSDFWHFGLRIATFRKPSGAWGLYFQVPEWLILPISVAFLIIRRRRSRQSSPFPLIAHPVDRNETSLR